MASRALTLYQPDTKPAVNHDDVLAMVTRFEEAEQATADAREKAERDRDYYDGKQWTETETKALKKRGQPVVTFNRIQRKVNYLKGLESQTRKDPKCFPREPGDDNAAQAATDALRYVVDDSDWDHVRSEAFENILVEGTAAIMVGAKDGKQGIDPKLIQIPWDRFWYDPHARRVDFSDAKYMGIVTWMDEDTARVKWPDAGELVDDAYVQERSSNSQTYDDRPQHQIWSDPKRKRVRVVESYYTERGQWMRCVFIKSGFLEPPEPSPYLDEDDKPCNPIHAISAYVDRDNNRYGEVRAMISPQDEVNKRRSKGLHLINQRQFRISRNAQAEPSTVKRELAKPDGGVVADKDEFEILDTSDMARGNFEMLQEAKAEIDLLGPNAAMAGKNENEQSGRALLAQQQGGMVEVALLMDRLRQLSLSVYRAIWARVRQYWKEPRWVRVTDDPRKPRFVGINQPRTMKDLMKSAIDGDQSSLEALGEMSPQLAQVFQAAAQGDQEATAKIGMLLQSGMADQPVKVDNNVGEIDVDITIDEGMDTPTVAAEQFDTILKTLPALQGQPPEVMELIIQASSLRDKDKLLEIVKKIGAQPQIPPELQEQIEEGQQRLAELEAENQQLKADQSTEQVKIQTSAELEAVKAQAKAQSDVTIAQIKAQTDIETAKIKAEADAAIGAMRARQQDEKRAQAA